MAPTAAPSSGCANAGCRASGTTPRPTWNPDIDQPINFFDGWQEVPDCTTYDNAFKIQWEEFLKHVALDTPFPWSLREGAKGVQLAELGLAKLGAAQVAGRGGSASMNQILITKPEELAPNDHLARKPSGPGPARKNSSITRTKARLCAAALLPVSRWAAGLGRLRREHPLDAGRRGSIYGVELVPVLNADTGYIFDLDDALYAEVLAPVPRRVSRHEIHRRHHGPRAQKTTPGFRPSATGR